MKGAHDIEVSLFIRNNFNNYINLAEMELQIKIHTKALIAGQTFKLMT